MPSYIPFILTLVERNHTQKYQLRSKVLQFLCSDRLVGWMDLTSDYNTLGYYRWSGIHPCALSECMPSQFWFSTGGSNPLSGYLKSRLDVGARINFTVDVLLIPLISPPKNPVSELGKRSKFSWSFAGLNPIITPGTWDCMWNALLRGFSKGS